MRGVVEFGSVGGWGGGGVHNDSDGSPSNRGGVAWRGGGGGKGGGCMGLMTQGVGWGWEGVESEDTGWGGSGRVRPSQKGYSGRCQTPCDECQKEKKRMNHHPGTRQCVRCRWQEQDVFASLLCCVKSHDVTNNSPLLSSAPSLPSL